MLGADALVAECSADLVHAVEPADEQPFEIELWGDTQDELQVEGVVVRIKRLGRGATADRMKQWRLDLEETEDVEEAAKRLHDERARAEDLGDRRIGEEVYVAFAVPLFDVFETVPLGGRGQEGFPEVLVAAGAHR
ncbi:MAG: hypothetical protein JRH14_04135 [Deltaproteobacteria bacterium]|nr:hypothetical protein [Deltaproteobacteria bacterium]